MANLGDYAAAGYFLSRHAGAHGCTGPELRRVTMAHDHSQRRFFPESWALSWCGETREQRIEEAAVFGSGTRSEANNQRPRVVGAMGAHGPSS